MKTIKIPVETYNAIIRSRCELANQLDMAIECILYIMKVYRLFHKRKDYIYVVCEHTPDRIKQIDDWKGKE